MKSCVLALTLATGLFAQQNQTRTVTYDGMGQPMPSPSYSSTTTPNSATRTEKMESVNGRRVMVERVEERVVREDARGRVVERIVKRFDPNGNPGPAEKQTIEEDRVSPGQVVTRTTVYRADMSGNMALAERSVREARKSAVGETIQETVERGSINGGLEVAERRSTEVRAAADGETKNTVVYKRDTNGQLYEVLKSVGETKTTKTGAVENVATYEAAMGGFQLVSQTVKKTEKAANGNERVEVDVFTSNVPGVSNTSGKPQLREQQLIVRQNSNGVATETVDVRRPSVSDPGRLGPAMRQSETVCSGKCQ
jgi:hypothetical protein